MTFFYFVQNAWYLIYCKVKQTSAECKTKNEVFGFAYTECSQTYEKLVEGVLARDNDTLSDKNRKPPRIAPDGFR